MPDTLRRARREIVAAFTEFASWAESDNQVVGLSHVHESLEISHSPSRVGFQITLKQQRRVIRYFDRIAGIDPLKSGVHTPCAPEPTTLPYTYFHKPLRIISAGF